MKHANDNEHDIFSDFNALANMMELMGRASLLKYKVEQDAKKHGVKIKGITCE